MNMQRPDPVSGLLHDGGMGAPAGWAYGSVMTGVQYTYVRKFAFRGVDDGGNVSRPTANGNTVFVTFRYYPFQN